MPTPPSVPGERRGQSIHSQRFQQYVSCLPFYADVILVWLEVLIDLCSPQLLFQTTVRCLTCHELADDPAIVARLRVLYDQLDASTTPASVLLPWLPSPSMVKKLIASKKVYDIVNGAIKARVQSGVSHDDTLQMLLDHGDDKLVIVGVNTNPLILPCDCRLTAPTVHHGLACRRGTFYRNDR